jgi:hypothetical protein
MSTQSSGTDGRGPDTDDTGGQGVADELDLVEQDQSSLVPDAGRHAPRAVAGEVAGLDGGEGEPLGRPNGAPGAVALRVAVGAGFHQVGLVGQRLPPRRCTSRTQRGDRRRELLVGGTSRVVTRP